MIADPKNVALVVIGMIGTPIVGWNTIQTIETDRVQDRVLATLNSHGDRLSDVEAQVPLIPNQVNDKDRWTGSQQHEYSKSVEHRLGQLEAFKNMVIWEGPPGDD